MAKKSERSSARQQPVSAVMKVRRAAEEGDLHQVLPTLLKALGVPRSECNPHRIAAAARLLTAGDERVRRDAAVLLTDNPGDDLLRGVLRVPMTAELRPLELVGRLISAPDTETGTQDLVGGGTPKRLNLLRERLRSYLALGAGDVTEALIEPLIYLSSRLGVQTLCDVLDGCPGSGSFDPEVVKRMTAHIVKSGTQRTADEQGSVVLAWSRLAKRAERSSARDEFARSDILLTTAALRSGAATVRVSHPCSLVVAIAKVLSVLGIDQPQDLPAPEGLKADSALVLGLLRSVDAELAAYSHANPLLRSDALQLLVWGAWLLGDTDRALNQASQLRAESGVELFPVFGLLLLDVGLELGSQVVLREATMTAAAQLLSTRSVPWEWLEPRIIAVLGELPLPQWPLGPDNPGKVHARDHVLRIITSASRLTPESPLTGMLAAVVAEYEARGDRTETALPEPTSVADPGNEDEEAVADELNEEAVLEVLAGDGPRSLSEALDVREWVMHEKNAHLGVAYGEWVLTDAGRHVLSDAEVLQELVALGDFVTREQRAGFARELLWKHIGRHSYAEIHGLVVENNLADDLDVQASVEEHRRRTLESAVEHASARENSVRVLFVGGNEVQEAYFDHLEQELEEEYRGRVRVSWVSGTWGPNWQTIAQRVDRQLASHDVVCIMTFVPTLLGARVRRLADDHSVPWVGVTGHGRASLLGALRRAVEVVDRLADG